MDILVLQHAPYEDIGNMSARFAACGASVRHARLFEVPVPSSLDGTELIVAMGGPMSVNDEAQFPWLREEKKLLRGAIEAGIPVLGVCLGAQLIASALGARVHPAVCKEIGWFPVEGVAVEDGGFCLPGSFTAFHWHGETFDLPPGAVRLARTQACENQAFRLGHHVVGLQFHLEMTSEAVEAMIEYGADELSRGGQFVQGCDAIRAAEPSAFSEADDMLGKILAYLAAGTAPGTGTPR